MYELTGTREEWENYIKEKIKGLEKAIANFSVEDDETVDAVNQRVMEQTNEHVKKLIKKFTPQEEEDSLPF